MADLATYCLLRTIQWGLVALALLALGEFIIYG